MGYAKGRLVSLHANGLRRTYGTVTARAAAFALIAFAVLASAAPALGAERARLTWDTDRTDVDLHVWDSSGNHA